MQKLDQVNITISKESINLTFFHLENGLKRNNEKLNSTLHSILQFGVSLRVNDDEPRPLSLSLCQWLSLQSSCRFRNSSSSARLQTITKDGQMHTPTDLFQITYLSVETPNAHLTRKRP